MHTMEICLLMHLVYVSKLCLLFTNHVRRQYAFDYISRLNII